jgi:hypothetical protein
VGQNKKLANANANANASGSSSDGGSHNNAKTDEENTA